MGTLQLSDGTTTVSLLDSAGLYLTRRGWKPQVARENELGDDYDDVVEVINLEWMQTTDDSRDTIIHNLNRLNMRAREYQRHRKTTGQVWLAAATHSETNTRYALVKEIYAPEMDGRHWGPNSNVKLTLTITREGAWRDQAPNTNPHSYTSITDQTVYNQVDVDGGTLNYFDVAAASLTGDAYGLPVFQMPFSTTQQKVIVALRSRPSSGDVTPFNPHFNAANFGTATYIVADATAPGGQKWERTILSGSSSMENYVALPAGLQYYTGSFLLYAVCKATTAVFSLQASHSTSTAFVSEFATEAVSIGITTNYQNLYLGRVTLPLSGQIPGVGDPTNYYIHLKCAWTGAGVFSLRNFFLVPTDDGIFQLDLQDQNVAADSILERSWHYSSTNKYVQKSPSPRGRYIRLKPNHYTRFMFFFSRSDAAGGVNPDDSIAPVNLRAATRYLALRGNT